MRREKQSTYALLTTAQVKEKGRDLFETGVFTVFTLVTVLAIWQFAAVAKPLPKALRASLHHHTHKAHFVTGSRPS